MTNADDYILGNEELHKRLCTATEILAEFVMVAPRPLSIPRLAGYTARPEKELVKLCRTLWRAGLLAPAPIMRDQWTLACEPSAVTLEDVFQVITAAPGGSKRSSEHNNQQSDHIDDGISLLLMQAAIGIRQSTLAHLRQFRLDRLKPGTAAAFSVEHAIPS